MKFIEKLDAGRQVLELRGDFDRYEVGPFLQRIDALVAVGCRDLQLDLGSVPFLSGAAVGALVGALHVLESHGGVLHFVELSGVARWTLATLGVEQLFVPDCQRAA